MTLCVVDMQTSVGSNVPVGSDVPVGQDVATRTWRPGRGAHVGARVMCIRARALKAVGTRAARGYSYRE